MNTPKHLTHPQIHLDFYAWLRDMSPAERAYLYSDPPHRPQDTAMFAWSRSRELLKESTAVVTIDQDHPDYAAAVADFLRQLTTAGLRVMPVSAPDIEAAYRRGFTDACLHGHEGPAPIDPATYWFRRYLEELGGAAPESRQESRQSVAIQKPCGCRWHENCARCAEPKGHERRRDHEGDNWCKHCGNSWEHCKLDEPCPAR